MSQIHQDNRARGAVAVTKGVGEQAVWVIRTRRNGNDVPVVIPEGTFGHAGNTGTTVRAPMQPRTLAECKSWFLDRIVTEMQGLILVPTVPQIQANLALWHIFNIETEEIVQV